MKFRRPAASAPRRCAFLISYRFTTTHIQYARKHIHQYLSRAGTQPQLIIEDAQGRKWRAKVGPEAQAETVAARLLWAVGYFSDETYYLPRIKVEGLDDRIQLSMPGTGIIRGYLQDVRVAPELTEGKFIPWNWYKNPLKGTREFDGLRVMMALINNWDLKKSNNRVAYDETTSEARYMVHDLGASFGRTGGLTRRSKNNPRHYAKEEFIKRNDGEKAHLVMKSRPHWLLLINPVYYRGRLAWRK